MKRPTQKLVHAAIIAALYVVLTHAANLLGLASGAIQLRLSEALTVLPLFTPTAVPGLFAGCVLANLTTGCAPWDVVFGSLATLIGAGGTYGIGRAFRTRLPKAYAPLGALPPIVSNTLIVPFVLQYVYRLPGGIPYFMLTVGVGEILSCGLLGLLLFQVLQKYRRHLFPTE